MSDEDGYQTFQQEVFQRQDDQLAELARSANNLNQAALVINSELAEHQRILNELEEDVDNTNEKLQFVRNRLKTLLHAKDGKQLCLIIWLFLIFILMCLLVVYV